MISSKVIQVLTPLFNIITNAKGKTIGQIKQELLIGDKCKMKKGASGLIIENLLGIDNNNRDEADIPQIGCEIKILPLQKNRDGSIKAKEPTAIQMINYCEVAKETWETAKLRNKINLTFWVVYLAKENGMPKKQDDYIIVDYFLDHPSDIQNSIFKTDWEEIQSYIIQGNADKLSCSMGTYLEPKTKGANNQDKTDAPDGHGGLTKVRRRAFYYKKNYTNTQIIPHLDLSTITSE
ncbi:MutH/Sau3AI family endonuclease [Barnesiella viscericola]|uniref:MutH/Sau3AI family endonuclease n=1 Tax=Barnesiella viscericola TaxID=397865 RepID=UPI0025A44F02|nr:MutH/Sau3AI family endonuclease [Barnesiella viscericola]MDM8267631.1 MutH/Sau3AI family endonuclease [Barnesiella viscericola]